MNENAKGQRKKRSQAVNTPAEFVPAIAASLGGSIGIDPCSNLKSVVPARVRVYYRKRRPWPEIPGTRIVRGNGLEVLWHEHAQTGFVNQEWANLGAWLRKCAFEHAHHGMEIVNLAPLRPHRAYWPWAWSARAACFLKPVRFEGWRHQFPGACVMLYWGENPWRFMDAFAQHGDVLTHLPRGFRLPGMADLPARGPEWPLLDYLLAQVTDPGELEEAVLRALPRATVGDLTYLAQNLEGDGARRLHRLIDKIPVGKRPSGSSRQPAKKKTSRRKAANGSAPRTADAFADVATWARSRQPDYEIRIHEVQNLFSISRSTAQRYMKKLMAAGDAKAQGSGAARCYYNLATRSTALPAAAAEA